jgi:hypothetical protein
MPYRVEYQGRKIECDTPEEAIRLVALDAAASKGKPAIKPQGPGTPPPVVGSTNGTTTLTAASQSGKLLQVVKGAGDHGVLNETLVTALGLQGGRGLGPLMLALRKDLAGLGMQPSDVVEVRREGKRRRWFYKGRIDEALRGFGAA